MGPRKQLWSDGWELERQQVAAPSASAPAATQPAVRAPRRPGRRTVALAAGAVVVSATAAWLIASPAGSTARRSSPARTLPARTLPAAPVRADALGLELAGAPGRRVVVEGVVAGSPATAVGIGAGEVLGAVNGHPVTTPRQVEAILDKLPLGTPVTLDLTQGQAQITAEIQEPGIP